MPDNTILNPGALGDTIATLDVGGVKHEKVIVEFLNELGNPVMVSAADPLPMYNVNSTSVQFLTSTAGQSVFTFTGVPASYSDYIIFVNGIALEPTTQFTASGNDITLVTPRDLNDRVRFQRIQG